ncbi:MAG: hypothetical protein HOP18_27175 [Deltaproteobacteria bacterium]|nr:hypothetical protein [Deltaproteobacteria bacterium]
MDRGGIVLEILIDASSLIVLARLNALGLLLQSYGRVGLTASVYTHGFLIKTPLDGAIS